MHNPHVPPGFWRGVNINQNAIYLECFMDELAVAAGQDPLEFKRKLMSKHPKHQAVLNAVAEKAGWGKPAPKGVFRGMAQHMRQRLLCRGSRGNLGDRRQQDQSSSDHLRNGSWLCRQPRADRTPDCRLVRLRAFSTVRPGMHGEERPHRAGQLQQVQLDADREMPKVEAIVMPSGGSMGRRR